MRRLRQRFGIPDEKKEQKRAKSTTVPMGNLREDVMYYTTIQIGTPPQYMDVQLDTASRLVQHGFYISYSRVYSDLWVYTTDCRTCKPTSPLPTSDGTAQFYNKTVSSTISISNTTVGITYAGGDGVSGVLATEVVSVGMFFHPTRCQCLNQYRRWIYRTEPDLYIRYQSIQRPRRSRNHGHGLGTKCSHQLDAMVANRH